MSYRVDTTPNFEKEAKKLIKKYNSLKDEIASLIQNLEKTPRQGSHLGNDIYKIRLAIKSKGKGKRGGARVVTKVKVIDKIVYMFSIYNKGEKDDISNAEIQDLIKKETS
jgi:mRNA-degrading endonuclease RelE of RelBE toxin-antitoxin system